METVDQEPLLPTKDEDGAFIKTSSLLPKKVQDMERRLQERPEDAERWQALVAESAKYDIEYTRAAIQKAFVYFPNAIRLWILSIDLECRLAGILLSPQTTKSQSQPAIDQQAIAGIEKLFATCLKTVIHPELWRIYILYLKRKGGDAIDRSILQKAYDYALQYIGPDPDSGPLWSEYIEFIQQTKPANQYEEQMLMDTMRKAYQKAVSQPHANLESIWRDYDAFENRLNKLTVSIDMIFSI